MIEKFADLQKKFKQKNGSYLSQLKYYKRLISNAGTLSNKYVDALKDENPDHIPVINAAYDEILKDVGISDIQTKK